VNRSSKQKKRARDGSESEGGKDAHVLEVPCAILELGQFKVERNGLGSVGLRAAVAPFDSVGAVAVGVLDSETFLDIREVNTTCRIQLEY
jgi:hypothetical protein